MDDKTVRQVAATLVGAHGLSEALSLAATQVIECGVTGDRLGELRWQAIADELHFLAQPPRTSLRDIYRTAHLLLGAHGEIEALQILTTQARSPGLMHPGIYPLLRAAVVDLARREPGWQDLLQ